MLIPNKNIFMCGLADRNYCGMGNSAFGGYGINLFNHRIGVAEHLDFVMCLNMLGDYARRNE